MPAFLLGGSSTLICSILGLISTPKSDAFNCSIGFFLAFIIFGSEAYLGSFNLRSQVTIAGTFISIVSKPSSISLVTSNLPSLISILDAKVATFASKIEIKDGKLEVTREIDEGLETIEINVPAIVTCDLRLNEPRYASLPNIMKAKKKPIEQLNASDLGVDISPRIEQIKVEEPPKRKAGIKVASVSELVHKLKNEAKVI